MSRALVVIAAAAALALAGLTDPADEAPDTPAERWKFTAASCDENDRAVDVEPDTPEAWASAQDWCVRSGEAIRNLPLPSGLTH